LRGIVEDLLHKQRRVRCAVASFSHLGALVEATALLATVSAVVARHILARHPRLATMPPQSINRVSAARFQSTSPVGSGVLQASETCWYTVTWRPTSSVCIGCSTNGSKPFASLLLTWSAICSRNDHGHWTT
jgi:hypothetical protein